MTTPKSPIIKKVFDDFDAKLKADEKIDGDAALRLMALLNGDQIVTAQKASEALFPSSCTEGTGE